MEFDEEGREEIWVKHYSSSHQILLVGDGDFSFSLCLALSFGSGFNIVATSLDSYEDVIKKYKKSARSNLEMLRKLGACVLHGVDATKMKLHIDLQMRKFDRIIYNFPHAGFIGKEDNDRVIGKHRKLVHGFFRNASGMLRANGEIHVTHKTTFPFCQWKIGELAWQNSLYLIECVDFKQEDYPGYKNKRGAGNRCDEPFPLGPCSTFKFIMSRTANKTRNSSSSPYVIPQQLQIVQRQPCTTIASCEAFWKSSYEYYAQELPSQPSNAVAFERRPLSPDIMHMNYIPRSMPSHPQPSSAVAFERRPVSPDIMHMNYIPRSVSSHPPTVLWGECTRNFNNYLNNLMETFRRSNYSMAYLVETLKLGFERYGEEKLGRPLSYYVNLLIQQLFTI